jgi:tetratricopeptide (TPR) repeat protein
MVTIVGEPGVGKSRLVAELFSHIDNLSDLITWRQGRCLPYGDGITFWALGEIVKAHAGIFESDSAEVATAKIEAVLSEGDDRPWFRARLLPLVGVETGQPASREESFTAWRRFLENIAEEGPTIVVVEDIHWADEALLDFLEHLADWAQGVPMVVACTARPELYERRQAWGAGLSNHTPIRLNRLTDVETARLVAVLLNQTVLPAETQQLVLERASGNPLYAEEFARMLRDRDLLDEHGRLRSDSDVAVPDSIQALIAARLDTLPPARKQLLQDAAVVGKVFWAGAIAAMGGRPSDEVEVALHELSRKELVRPSRQTSMAGETEYGFWHVLVRDVSYGQIPRHERAVRHAKAADWIEKKAGERVEDLAEVLAFHSGAARDNALATGNTALADEMAPRLRRFAALAGERAAGLDTGKALQLLSKALELTPTDDPERAEVLVRWGTAALDAGKARAASDAFGEAVALARATDQGERLAAALIALSRVQRDLSGEGGVDYAREAVTALSGLPPGRSLTEAWAYLSVATMLSGGYSAAIDSAEESFRIAADLGLPPPSTAFQGRASARCMMGDVGGLADGRRAIELSVEEGAGGSAGIQYNNLGIDTLLFEGPERAFSVFDEGMAFAAPRGLVRGMNTIRSSRVCMLPLAGRLTETILEADELIPLLQEGGDNLDRFLVMSARCYALQELGVPEPEAAELLLGAMSRVDADLMVDAAIAAAPTRMAMADIRGALDILEELSEFDGLEESTDYAFLSTALVRCAIEAGSAPLADKLCSRVQPGLPMASVARAACEALTAEMRGEPPEASARFAAVAADWKAFGCRLEYAYALLGQGRCLAAIDDPSAVRVLQWALSEFDQMGAKPRVEECKVLLTAAAATSA